MLNTLAVIGKLKRLGQKLLISGGYIDSLGRRRQPPKLVEGRRKVIFSDLNNNVYVLHCTLAYK